MGFFEVVGLFEIVINLIESMLFAYFIFKSHKLKYDKQFALLTGIVFSQEMISSYINNQNKLILFVIPVTLILYQWIRFKKLSINYILMGVMSVLIIYFSNVISLLIAQVIFRISSTYSLIIAIILSKIIGFILIYYCTGYINIGEEDVPQVWQFNLVVVLLIAIMDIDIQGILDNRDTGTYVYVRIIIIALLVLLLYRFLRQFIENTNQRIYYELELQKVEYEKKNAKVVLQNKVELERLDHNLKYTLMSILFHASHSDLEAVKEQANNYLGRVTMVSHAIATQNPYFDYVFNEVIHEFKLNGIFLKRNMMISQNSLINNHFVADKIVVATKKTMDLALENGITTVDIRILEDGDICFVYFLLNYNDLTTIKSYVENNFNDEYVVDLDDQYGILKLSMAIDLE